MSDSVEWKLWDAAENGRASEVSSLLRDHPEINVNWTDNEQWTPLHVASLNGHVEVVKLLLAHPNININLKNDEGQTPLSVGCQYGRVSVVELLLKDRRVDVTPDDDRGRTPLWWTAYCGCDEVVEWLIASGSDLGDIKNKKGKWDGKDFNSLEIARRERNTEVRSTLERFMANPVLTRHELRVKLGMLDALAAEVFALTVFLCDDLLQLKPDLGATSELALRFFVIASKLPMELQMILCYFTVGSTKQNILRRDSEAAFKSLARILLS